MIPRIGVLIDRLQPAGAVYMSDRWDQRPLVFTDLENLHHEGDVIILLEPIRHRFVEYRRRKWTKGFPPLDLGIENRFHVGPTRIADDRAIAERAWPPFHAALKPSDDLPLGDRHGRPSAQLCLVRNILDRATGRVDLGLPGGHQHLDIARTELRTPISVVHYERPRPT